MKITQEAIKKIASYYCLTPATVAAVAERVLAAASDSQLDSEVEPTDAEILELYVEHFGGTQEQAIERLGRFALHFATGNSNQTTQGA